MIFLGELYKRQMMKLYESEDESNKKKFTPPLSKGEASPKV